MRGMKRDGRGEEKGSKEGKEKADMDGGGSATRSTKATRRTAERKTRSFVSDHGPTASHPEPTACLGVRAASVRPFVRDSAIRGGSGQIGGKRNVPGYWAMALGGECDCADEIEVG